MLSSKRITITFGSGSQHVGVGERQLAQRIERAIDIVMHRHFHFEIEAARRVARVVADRAAPRALFGTYSQMPSGFVSRVMKASTSSTVPATPVPPSI